MAIWLNMNGLLWLAWAIYWTISARRSRAGVRVRDHFFLRVCHLTALFLGFFFLFGWPVESFLGAIAPFQNAGVRLFGEFLTLAGLAFSVWARIHLGKYWSGQITLVEGHRLIRTGPYQRVRHPIYTGFLSAVVGTCLVNGSRDSVAGAILIWVIYLLKIRREEKLLTKEFGDEYLAFKREVPRLVPVIFSFPKRRAQPEEDSRK